MSTMSHKSRRAQHDPTDLSNLPVNGKVLRLHFACRARLPHGSMLRVTSSAFWATMASSTNPLTDPSNQNPTNLTAADNTSGNGTDDRSHGGNGSEESGIYSSSVEMVTDPDTYPLWRTRTPVIAVVNSVGGSNGIDALDDDLQRLDLNISEDSEEQRAPPSPRSTEPRVFQHRYRYVVVTPGAGTELGDGSITGADSGGGDDRYLTNAADYGTSFDSTMTSDGLGGMMSVGMWEDPFKDDERCTADDDAVRDGNANRNDLVSTSYSNCTHYLHSYLSTELDYTPYYYPLLQTLTNRTPLQFFSRTLSYNRCLYTYSLFIHPLPLSNRLSHQNRSWIFPIEL